MNPQLMIAQAQPGGLQAVLGSLALPIMIFLIFYFIWFMPLRKKQKEQERLIASLKKGDKVVTTGGLLGEVTKADEAVVMLKLADNVKIRVRRSAIAGLEGEPEAKGT